MDILILGVGIWAGILGVVGILVSAGAGEARGMVITDTTVHTTIFGDIMEAIMATMTHFIMVVIIIRTIMVEGIIITQGEQAE